MNTKSASLAAAGTVLLWASAFPAITVAVRGLGPRAWPWPGWRSRPPCWRWPRP